MKSKMQKLKLFLLFFLNVIAVQSQQYQIDSSYTIKSTYAKLIKKYPLITIPEIKPNQDVQVTFDLVYNKEKERELHLDAFVNKKNKKSPAVIMIHGGGWRSGNKDQMQFLGREIASKGYSAFSIEYRLSLEAKYPTGVIDVKNAIKFIKDNASKFNVNVNKIAVLGCSSGGQMAALIGTTNNNSIFEDKAFKSKSSSKVNAIIDVDGVLAFKHPESSEGDMAAFWLGGKSDEIPEIWKEASALTHTDKNTPPVLYICSSIPRFHAGRDDMIKILNENKIYNEVQTIPDSPHSFWFYEPWFKQTISYTIQFLDKIFK
ncbi:pectinesterase [Flavobacterium nitrogenifigens]|uniref:Pectinesterase n=2 Tax=Flavobacterium TaxID=237 RepID=A0A7W7IXY0_9FLAO|nr:MULTISPECIES: alpha/beta hydrolase [Flavobacterium]MBB4802318.1 pectinesterase [Flavobacterium nitrogenifigens]MBB6387276.1 pectinesterase [Flavobacterium notoginsengisoli]